MRIITYATHKDNFNLQFLKEKLNIELLEELLPWRDMWQGKYYYDFYARAYSTHQFVSSLDPEELVVMMDAYDVLPLNNCNPESLENKIKSCFDINKVTFCAESNCFPEASLAEKYPDQSYVWKYLNAGIFAGKAKAINLMLSITLPKISGSMDQLEFSNLFLESDLINLDYECNIFQSLFTDNSTRNIHWDHYEVKEKTIKNKIHNTYPLLFHGNGGIDMSELVQFI
jgi:hypothetical protein